MNATKTASNGKAPRLSTRQRKGATLADLTRPRVSAAQRGGFDRRSAGSGPLNQSTKAEDRQRVTRHPKWGNHEAPAPGQRGASLRHARPQEWRFAPVAHVAPGAVPGLFLRPVQQVGPTQRCLTCRSVPLRSSLPNPIEIASSMPSDSGCRSEKRRRLIALARPCEFVSRIPPAWVPTPSQPSVGPRPRRRRKLIS